MSKVLSRVSTLQKSARHSSHEPDDDLEYGKEASKLRYSHFIDIRSGISLIVGLW
jgi:hypothetical protein